MRKNVWYEANFVVYKDPRNPLFKTVCLYLIWFLSWKNYSWTPLEGVYRWGGGGILMGGGGWWEEGVHWWNKKKLMGGGGFDGVRSEGAVGQIQIPLNQSYVHWIKMPHHVVKWFKLTDHSKLRQLRKKIYLESLNEIGWQIAATGKFGRLLYFYSKY